MTDGFKTTSLVVRSLQSFAPELADLAKNELSKRGMCSSVVLGNLDDDDFVLLRRCLPDPMWSVLPHVVMEARIACKQQVLGIRWRRRVPGECKQELSRVGHKVGVLVTAQSARLPPCPTCLW